MSKFKNNSFGMWYNEKDLIFNGKKFVVKKLKFSEEDMNYILSRLLKSNKVYKKIKRFIKEV